MPNVWEKDNHSDFKGMALTRGYIRFFEPDVYVEAKPGLAAECGIDKNSGSPLFKRVVTLEDFVTYKDGRAPEFAFSLNILDVYRELYLKEYRFESKHPRQVVLFEGSGPDGTFAEALSGAFPEDEGLSFIRRGFLDTFDPEIKEVSARDWTSALQQRAGDPLAFTSYGFDRQPGASGNPRLFIADPSNPHDLIDLWNLRQFCDQVLPVNVKWLSELRGFLTEIIKRTHRPLPGNPHGVMINTTIEFGRSISVDRTEEICRTTFNDLPQGSCTIKSWYDRIWEFHSADGIPKQELAVIEAKSGSVDLDYEHGKELVAEFPAVSPSFAQRYGASNARWVNVLSLSDFTSQSALALALPSTSSGLFGTRLIGPEAFMVTREGFVLPQKYRDTTQFFRLPTGRKAILEWLGEQGIEATPSEPGRIADQILARTDGFRRAYLLSHEETLKTLDKMARREHKRGDGKVEGYPDRTAPVSDWEGLINRRKQEQFEPTLEIKAFVEVKALRLGLAIRCAYCEYETWYGIGQMKERLTCERCLQEFDFPQGTLDSRKTPWRFRVTGPFSVPDFARGAYTSVLALRCLATGLVGLSTSISYSSSLNLQIGGRRREIDFACWYTRERAFRHREDAIFVVGESKSFADKAIDKRDIETLKAIAQELPGTVLVIAVLKEELSSSDKGLICPLALWGREHLADGRWRAPLIVLTGKELFAPHNVEHEWRKSGGLREELTTPAYVQMDNLTTLADLTQQVYLDLPDYNTWLKDCYARRQ